MTKKQKSWLVAAIFIVALAIDQVLKFYIKLNFTVGESVGPSWLTITFVENNGMAFGISWLPKWFLTVFRIIAVGLLCWYIRSLIKSDAKPGYLATVSLVTVGALGNVIDCLFYGMIFSESTYYQVAHLVPWGQGYGTVLYGKVVDMIQFSLIRDDLGNVVFFSPICNFADCCITVAVFLIILFYRTELNDSLSDKKAEEIANS